MNRNSIADFVRDITPQVVELGPPLPEMLHIRWPGKIPETLTKWELATATGGRMKDSIINKIRGR